jgi:hypothetical protein
MEAFWQGNGNGGKHEPAKNKGFNMIHLHIQTNFYLIKYKGSA